MPLAPKDIESKEFSVALRGYEKEEVEAFLRAIAADYRAALGEGNYEAIGSEIGQILQSASDSVSAMKARTDAEIAARLKEAEADAATIRSAAKKEAADLNKQVAGLRRQIEAEIEAVKDTAAQIRAQAEKDAAATRATAETEAAQIKRQAQEDVLTPEQRGGSKN